MMVLMIAAVVIFSVVTVVYLLKNTKNKKTDDFLTARNSAGTWQIAFSVIAVVMGSWALFSPAEAAITGGVAACIGYAVAQGVAIMLFAFLGVKLRRMIPDGSSMTEYVLARYGTSTYILVLIIGVFYLLLSLAAELTGISAAVNMVWGVPIAVTIVVLIGGVLAYTTLGGIMASLFADRMQTIVIIPTLLIAFIGCIYFSGGPGHIIETVNSVDKSFLSLGNVGGWTYAAGLAIAILSAELFNQCYWQRVYASRSEKTVKRAFGGAGTILIFMLLICGLFGIMAIAQGAIDNPSIAMFLLLVKVAPAWLIGVVMILAVALVMSTSGAVINGVSSVLACDLKRYTQKADPKKLLKQARLIAIAVAVIAGLIALKGISVLYLFLIADLLCTAAVVPTFMGLFKRKLPGWAATISIVAGIIAGIIQFPNPTWARGNLLYAYLLAIGVSTIISLIFSHSGSEVKLEELNSKIRKIQEEEAVENTNIA